MAYSAVTRDTRRKPDDEDDEDEVYDDDGEEISQFGVSKNTCARRDKKKHIFLFFCHAKYTHEFALKKVCIFKICLILSRRAHVFFETPN